MKTIDEITADRAAATTDLRAFMKGTVLQREDADYASSRHIWNGAVTHQPAMIALCETVEDVQAAVRVARLHDIPLSVRGGGHDWAGRALRHDGLVIDLTKMRQVEVDAQAGVATIGGGATATDLMAAAAPHGLAAVTGNVGAVGMAGFLLAGGYGPLTTRFGLALDNLLGVEIVLADGLVVTADASENADLFWALRGGGGNFGVVTTMRIRLHPVDQIVAGMILFPWSEAESVLRGHAEIMASAPEELSALVVLASLPDGSPVVVLGPVWTGDPAWGPKVVARLEGLGTPIMSQVGPMAYGDLLRLFDAQAVEGRHYALKTRWLAELTPEVISSIVAAGTARTSPFSVIALHHFHGPGARVPLESTAFGLRQEHFLMEIIAAWEPVGQEKSGAHRQWVSDLFAAVAPHALPGGYPNFLTQEDREQVSSAYGSNAVRLRALKGAYDPDNVFSSATPIAAPN
jgi:FAD/FMN-containing dehydrogenase